MDAARKKMLVIRMRQRALAAALQLGNCADAKAHLNALRNAKAGLLRLLH